MTDTSTTEVVEKAEPGKESTPETARDVLQRIAANNTGDIGDIARLLLASVEGDEVTADETIPVAYVGERKMDEAGNLWEYTDQGWFPLSELQADKAEAEKQPEVPDATEASTKEEWAPPWARPQTPPETNPLGGNPTAPNTTVGDGSEEGKEV